MSDVEYLQLDDLLALVRALRTGPVRDVGLLSAAAARPQATVFGEEAYPTVPQKAAALLHSLVGNHALVDGNKRLGWLATVVFLDLNGHAPDLDDEAAFVLVMDVAAGGAEVAEIADRLRAVPIGRGASTPPGSTGRQD
ncbi:type II toxin-antitoxin system death-on-curing family toxin [Modestobacter roseus]|uniref:Death-on-curing protein n=1 Tax=Modestobacter roseus TaxID=1181884 RepID=A0A562IS22_9ACTN|nr:Fic family protein [Modestobacter roseus]MQA35956.1 alcohol dehydrogenase [Modestobacter roseus]TWH73616.1 death-on-curing protein [Modestobacter roseus]